MPVLVVHGVWEVLRLESDAHVVRVALHSGALTSARRIAAAACVEPVRCVHLNARLIGVQLHKPPTRLPRDDRCGLSGRSRIENKAVVDTAQPAVQMDSLSQTLRLSVQ